MQKKKCPGRPRMPDDCKGHKFVTIRFTGRDYDAIKKSAERKRVSISGFIRMMVSSAWRR